MIKTLRSVVAAAALLCVGGAGVSAQTFPTRPVTLIVPWTAGGSTDLGMRSLAEATQKYLGQPIVIENKPGAGGTLGPAQVAATGKPDGYTLTQIPVTVFRIPAMQKTTFDPSKDFTYIIHLSGYTFGVVVKADAPWKTFQEFLADAKANPGKISYGTPGAGTSLHVTMEQIAKQQGIKFRHVPFKGNAETNAAVLGGHVSAAADSSGWGALVNSGDLRLLVTWGAERTKSWPNVPTLKEAGVNMVSNSPFGIAGPKGMDPKIVQILHDAFKKGSEDPIYKAALEKFDQEAFYLNTADYNKYAMEQVAEQKQIIEELGLKQN